MALPEARLNGKQRSGSLSEDMADMASDCNCLSITMALIVKQGFLTKEMGGFYS